jgi:protoheme IX farnesyltransferase
MSVKRDIGSESIALERSRAHHFLALAKPELTLLSVLTSLGGAYLGVSEQGRFALLLATFAGTLCVGAGAGALNMLIERELDAKMRRTGHRPIPSGLVAPSEALAFGLLCSLIGVVILTLFTNWLAGLLALLTLVTYLFLYTPLKQLTPFATVVGAVPGALPPVIGWAAARGEVGLGGWSLFAILFFWQVPHFLSLAWVYRNDYARAGYRLLAVLDLTGSITRRQILVYAFVLVPASLLPTYAGLVGPVYFAGALGLSVTFFVIALASCRPLTRASARRLFLSSLGFLPVLILFMILDRI